MCCVASINGIVDFSSFNEISYGFQEVFILVHVQEGYQSHCLLQEYGQNDEMAHSILLSRLHFEAFLVSVNPEFLLAAPVLQ